MSLLLWLAAVGCGESTSNDGPSAGSAGQPAAAGSAATGGSLASGGSAAGTSNTSAGSPSAGTATASGGSNTAAGGSTGSSAAGAAGAQEPAEGGASAGGAAGGLAVCDPKKALCKLLPGECPGMQVRAVVGTCWGECVDIADCACSAADDCPDNDKYTCWSRSHCGPYVN